MVDNKLKKILETIYENKKFVAILIIAAIFIYITIKVYQKYVSPKNYSSYIEGYSNDPDKSTTSKDSIKEANLYLFKVDWCPHCKKAMPVWQDLASEYDNKVINGYKVNFIVVDGEQDAAMADKFKIEGYPTIKLVKDSNSSSPQVIEYDAKVSKPTLIQFLESTL